MLQPVSKPQKSHTFSHLHGVQVSWVLAHQIRPPQVDFGHFENSKGSVSIGHTSLVFIHKSDLYRGFGTAPWCHVVFHKPYKQTQTIICLFCEQSIQSSIHLLKLFLYTVSQGASSLSQSTQGQGRTGCHPSQGTITHQEK